MRFVCWPVSITLLQGMNEKRNTLHRVIKWSASWWEEVYRLVKILKTVAPDVQDTTKLHKWALWNKADWYEKALKHLHSSPMVSIPNIWRSAERLPWVSLWKVSGKESHYPNSLPPRLPRWMNLLAAEPQMTGDQQRNINRGTREDANSGIPLPMLSLFSHTKTRSRARTLVFSPRGSALPVAFPQGSVQSSFQSMETPKTKSRSPSVTCFTRLTCLCHQLYKALGRVAEA